MVRSVTRRGGQQRPSPRRRARPRAARRPSVLLIADDNSDARELYGEYFSNRGFTVITANDGAAAVRAALDHVPDVIVMDLAMPQFDGITALRRIKADPRTTRIRVMILTGYPHAAVERRAYEAGADLFLTKPCLPEDLGGHVKKLLRRRRSS
jgi:two-component system cell cycle response regulator DivK